MLVSADQTLPKVGEQPAPAARPEPSQNGSVGTASHTPGASSHTQNGAGESTRLPAILGNKHLSIRGYEKVAKALGARDSRDRKLLAAALVQGELSEEECKQLGDAARSDPGCLRRLISTSHPSLSSQSVTEITCYAAGLPWTALSESQIDDEGPAILHQQLAVHLNAIVMGHGEEPAPPGPDGEHRTSTWVHVAIADPWAVDTVTELKSELGEKFDRVEVFGADADRVRQAIRSQYVMHATGIDAARGTRTTRRSAGDAEMRKLMHDTVEDAVKDGASDITIGPPPGGQPGARIRLKVDGRWKPGQTILGEGVLQQFLNTWKNEFSLAASNSRIIQQGRATFELRDGRKVDLRAQFMPQYGEGEDAVFRLLDSNRVRLDLSAVGFKEDALRRFRAAVRRPTGCVLMCGPMGSGKTTTLYAALAELNDPSRKIVTIEDPVEYRVPGISQTQVDERFEVTYAEALRGYMRAAPDVIMVGEIRDPKTADVAMRGAVTGVLLLSTIHANSAVDAPSTLIQYGVEPQYVAAALLLIVSQRLVRVLCPHCRIPAQPKPSDLMAFGYTKDTAGELLSALTKWGKFYDRKPDGCGYCSFGFSGRTAIQEMLVVTEDMRDLIAENRMRDLRAAALKAGMVTLAAEGIHRAAKGITSLTEVLETVGEVI